MSRLVRPSLLSNMRTRVVCRSDSVSSATRGTCSVSSASASVSGTARSRAGRRMRTSICRPVPRKLTPSSTELASRNDQLIAKMALSASRTWATHATWTRVCSAWATCSSWQSSFWRVASPSLMSLLRRTPSVRKVDWSWPMQNLSMKCGTWINRRSLHKCSSES